MIKSEVLETDGLAIRCVLQSHPDQVTETLRTIRAIVDSEAPFPLQDNTWELVVAEVLNNIVEHAYAGEGQGEIRVVLEFRPTTLRARFTDFGKAMPGHQPPDGKAANLDVEAQALPEGGFGWFLIRSLTTSLCYRHEAGANRLKVELPLAQTA